MALTVFNYTLNLQYIACCVISVTFMKFVRYMSYAFASPDIWYREIAYRYLVEWRDGVNGVLVPVQPNLNRKLLMNVIWTFMISLWLALQFTFIFLLMDIHRWNNVLQQIMMFHDVNNLPAPPINYETMNNYTSWWFFTKMFFVFYFGGCVLLTMVDMIFKMLCKIPQAGNNKDVITFILLIVATVWLMFTNGIVFNFTISESQVINLLKEGKDVQ